jgi:Acyl carrier protein
MTDKVTKEQIYEDLLKILSEDLSVSTSDITPELKLRNGLQFDSLELYSFVVDVEEQYDIRITDELIDKVNTMKDLVNIVDELINK